MDGGDGEKVSYESCFPQKPNLLIPKQVSKSSQYISSLTQCATA